MGGVQGPSPLDSGLRRKDGWGTAIFIPRRGLDKALGQFRLWGLNDGGNQAHSFLTDGLIS